MTIRQFKIEDWETVSRIYAEGAIPGKAVFHHDDDGVWHDLVLMERRSKVVEGGGCPCCCG